LATAFYEIVSTPFTANMNRNIILVIFIFVNTACSAQSVCEQLRKLKQQCYGFKPSEISEIEKERKNTVLDKFWDFAKSNKSESPECLKQMILAEKEDGYFCYDASALLLQLDEKQQYLDVVVEGLKKCRLKDLQLEPYLQICFFLGKKGKDISELAEKLISEPKATVFLTEHVITLTASDASLFLYNTMGTANAEKSLINTIETGNVTGRQNAAQVLNAISTPRGDSLINILIKKKQIPDSTINMILADKKGATASPTCNGDLNRETVLQRLKNYPGEVGQPDSEIAGNDELICSACKALTAEDIEIIRAARNRSTRGLSDEALYDYFALTKILLTVRNK